MADLDPARIAGVRKRIEELNARRIRAEEQERAAKARLAELRAEAKREFGVDSLEDLENLLATEQERLEREVAEMERTLDVAEETVARLPS